ncbi:MAG TPA: hypothetical protein VHE33_06835 [Acidobacteriaceae bacterium]|nr:hypothetical protein [Acidobacteriaceae bacterium]
MTLRRLVLVLAVLLLPCAIVAQTAPIEIPLEYSGRHLYVTVTDEPLGPLTLMLDTGFQRTTLAASVARKGEVHTHFLERSLSYNGFGGGKAKRRYLTTDVSLRSGTNVIFGGSALVTDLGDLNKGFGHAFDGFLGWDFFRQWCVTLEYAPARLTLRGQCSPPLGAYANLHGDWNPQGLLLTSQITFVNGHKADALLHMDTGSDITLLLNTRFREAAGLKGSASSAQESHGLGVNGRYTTDLLPIAKIDLNGQLQLAPGKDTMIAIGRAGAFTKVHWWEGPSAVKINRDGVIGNALLDRFRWTFDPGRKKIYAVPAGEK